MILNKLSIITSSLLLSTSLFAGFEAMNPLSSSSHDTTNQSNNKDVTISWNQATADNGDTLAGYYYILDTSSTTLIPNVVATRKTLGSIATTKTETVTGTDGSYYFHLAPYADGGNTGATLHFGPIKIDSTAPSALSVSPDGGSYSATQSVSMSATDANNYTIYYTTDDTIPTSSSTTYSSAITVSSSKTVKAIAIDSAGNSSTIKSSAFTVNTTTNVAQFGTEVTAGATIATNNDGNSASAIREVSVSGSSVTHYKYKIDTASFSAQIVKDTPIDLSTLTDGSHTISIVGYDGSTWQTDASATTLSFTVDNTAPSAIVFTPSSGATTFTEATDINISSSNSNNVYYTLNEDTPTSTVSATNFIVSDSSLVSIDSNATIKAIAFDTAGNKTSVAQALYTVVIPVTTTTTTTTTPTTTTTTTTPTNTTTTTTPTTPTEEEVVEEVTEETEEVVEEETPVEEVLEEIEDVVDETLEETVETPTEDTTEISSEIETGLSIDETVKVFNDDGTTTDTTSFQNAAGETIEVEVLTKISTASTVTGSDGTATTTATSEDGEIQVEVQINANGTVENKLTIGEESSDVNVAVVGADTTINEDGSIQTIAEVTTDEGVKTEATVEVNADGTTSNLLEVTDATGEKVSSEVSVAVVGADTTVKSDGAVETVAEVTTADNVKTEATVEVKADGSTANKVEVTNSTGNVVESKLDTNIAGADSSISSNGSVTMTTPDVVTSGVSVSVSVVADSTGTVQASFSVDEDVAVEMPEFEAGSAVDVKHEDGKVLVEVTTKLTKPVTYNQGE